jgi:hypothetical protein
MAATELLPGIAIFEFTAAEDLGDTRNREIMGRAHGHCAEQTLAV